MSQIDIDQLTEAELVDLNHRIVERLRFLDQLRAHQQMLTCQPEGRPPVVGMLVRYNRKSVTVITDDGQRWNVSPAPAPGGGGRTGHVQQGHAIGATAAVSTGRCPATSAASEAVGCGGSSQGLSAGGGRHLVEGPSRWRLCLSGGGDRPGSHGEARHD